MPVLGVADGGSDMKKRKRRKRKTDKNLCAWGSLGGTVVWRLPLAEGAILETQDRIPRRAPGAWSLLLPLPVSLCVCV